MALTPITPTPAAVSVAELADWLRLGEAADFAVLHPLARAATQMCETYIGQALVARDVVQNLAVGGDWQAISHAPVRAILSVSLVDGLGNATPLTASDYVAEIDVLGDARLRLLRSGSAVASTVTCRIGMAEDAGQLPDALRQGVILCAAHLYESRDAEAPLAPPASIAALWQIWRRVRLS